MTDLIDHNDQSIKTSQLLTCILRSREYCTSWTRQFGRDDKKKPHYQAWRHFRNRSRGNWKQYLALAHNPRLLTGNWTILQPPPALDRLLAVHSSRESSSLSRSSNGRRRRRPGAPNDIEAKRDTRACFLGPRFLPAALQRRACHLSMSRN